MIGICESCRKSGRIIKRNDGKKLCIRCYNREWKRIEQLDPIKRQKNYDLRNIHSFLFGRKKVHRYDLKHKRWIIQEKFGLFPSGGCCWVCGEVDLFSLETHHINKKEIMSLCGTCHLIFHRMGWNYLLNNRGRV